MRHTLPGGLVLLLALLGPATAQTTNPLPGARVEGLLALARERNPELASMRHEAQAATERVAPAGALMDPRFKVELQDITKPGDQGSALLPTEVGATA